MMVELFKRVGLQTNEVKTKFMVVRGAAAPRALNENVYNKMCHRVRTKRRAIFGKQEEWRKKMVECRICGKKMQNASLPRHMEQIHEGRKTEYEV